MIAGQCDPIGFDARSFENALEWVQSDEAKGVRHQIFHEFSAYVLPGGERGVTRVQPGLGGVLAGLTSVADREMTGIGRASGSRLADPSLSVVGEVDHGYTASEEDESSGVLHRAIGRASSRR
jgi:hypothetical protein